jgi:hypothetical protein
MEDIIKALKDTPIPTILVVAGIVFLLLAIAGQLSGRIVVAPDRQRWAAVIGGVLLVIGVTLTFIQPGNKSPQGSGNNQITQNSNDKKSPPTQKMLETNYADVVAGITQFDKSGELITLALTVRNNSNNIVRVCTHSQSVELIDQAGERWKALHTGGELRACGRLGPNYSATAWMKFNVPNPETRIFSLSSPLFNKPIDNLVLGRRP